MAWFKKDKKPKAVRESRERSTVPEGLWLRCDGCREIVYSKELERNLRICPKCGFHFRQREIACSNRTLALPTVNQHLPAYVLANWKTHQITATLFKTVTLLLPPALYCIGIRMG